MLPRTTSLPVHSKLRSISHAAITNVACTQFLARSEATPCLQVFNVSQIDHDTAPTKQHEPADDEEVRLLRSAERKALWHTMPFIIMMTFINYIDRTNLSFASLTMGRDLGLTAEQYGLGSGMFFIGYALFQVNTAHAMLACHYFER